MWFKKSISSLIAEAEQSGQGTLKRTLTSGALIALGIGAIVGAGLFVRTAAAAAQNAGPSVTIGFILAALGCVFAGLCYAELSSSIPVSGSAYTFTYATMGELMAWIIGWDLVLEYSVSAATVGIAWSEYLNHFLVDIIGTNPIPYAWCHSPFQTLNLLQINSQEQLTALQSVFEPAIASKMQVGAQLAIEPELLSKVPAAYQSLITTSKGIMNLPALLIVTVMSLLLVRGTSESVVVNNIIVFVKVTIVVLVILLGWQFIDPANHTPYIPKPTIYVDHEGISHRFGGIWGILGAAGTVFFAFIGFDAVSTAAQEAKNPKRTMPIGILGSLAVCTLLYVLFGHVLTGLVDTDFFRDPTRGGEASVVMAIQEAMPGYSWLSKAITVAILAGFSSVILVMLLGQSRVFYSMSKDGLLPKAFSDVHPKYGTPWKGNLLILLLVALFAAFVPGNVVGHMTSIGTLFAFSLVCLAVIILRKKEPNLKREFKTPLVPLIPILGIITCGVMIAGLGKENWIRLIVWILIGFVIYFGYGRKHSKIRKELENK